jgi:HD-GYP domain-containing protein (c-di-GMP phosphodiesterase class II)
MPDAAPAAGPALPLLLLHTAGWQPSPVLGALAADAVEIREISTIKDLTLDQRPTVLLLDAVARNEITPGMLAPLVDAGLAIVALGGEPDETDSPHALSSELVSADLLLPVAPRRLTIALRAAFREAAARRHLLLARAETADRTSEVSELTEVGIRLLSERSYTALLSLILEQARRITQSDAGSLYLVQTDDAGVRSLRFIQAQNDSRPDIPFVELTLPIDPHSIAGYAASTGEALVLDDVYVLPDGAPYAFNRSFDERYGYRTKSMLVVPMPNFHGDVIGVLQLINRKREPRLPFGDAGDVERRALPYGPHAMQMVRALAGHAAVSLENSQLHEAIERLFEGFVRAAVTAIEQRDPTTSGHSERVAALTVGLALTVDRVADGRYRHVRFSAGQVRELRYAALLHDFGKVAVRERVLVKGKKLYSSDLALIEQRHAFLVRSAEVRMERARADYLERHGRTGYDDFRSELLAAHRAERERLDRFLTAVHSCNEPSVVMEPAGPSLGELANFASHSYDTVGGDSLPLLTPLELRALSITKGTLDAAERAEIESHVAHTYAFLKRIPWTRELRNIPDIAHGHHEKLDGSGYPRGLSGDAIPIQTRMMTISDIYDALTAADRPYKRAVSKERAFEILEADVEGGMLDGELFRLFVEAKVFDTKVEP